MAPRRKSIPSYLLHTQTGRARAVWTDATGVRQFRMLPGRFDSKESKKAFRKLLLELEASPLQQQADEERTVADVLLAFRLHADQHYRGPDGKPTSEIHEVRIVIRALRELYADTPISQFTPLSVKAARAAWVQEGRSRSECNRRLGMVKRILKWGVSEAIVPVAVYQAVATVTGLQRGRTEAHEVDPVGPVEDSVVEATLPHLNRHVRGLIEFQRLTGCRPGEACSIRRSEIDTGGSVWLYAPTHHKTAHRGRSRTISIGPKAQELLKQFFTPDRDAYLFSPRRALAEVHGTTSRRRKNALGERYDRTSYTRAIARACEAMHPLPAHLARQKGELHKDWWKRLTEEEKAEVRAWREAHRWAPNQLRHQHATKIRKEFGLEAAQVALGHARADVTQIYAEKNAALAATVALKIG